MACNVCLLGDLSGSVKKFSCLVRDDGVAESPGGDERCESKSL